MIALLERIAIALETPAQPPAPEGFCGYGQKVYCNLTKGNGEGWYVLEDGNALTQPPIFRGRVVGLRFPTVERRGKEVVKFHLFMRAGGETKTFEAGRECFFSKTVLAALALASPEVLSRPLQLATYVKELRTGDRTLAVALRIAQAISCRAIGRMMMTGRRLWGWRWRTCGWRWGVRG